VRYLQGSQALPVFRRMHVNVGVEYLYTYVGVKAKIPFVTASVPWDGIWVFDVKEHINDLSHGQNNHPAKGSLFSHSCFRFR